MTLIELMVTIAVIALFFGLLMAVGDEQRYSKRWYRCVDNLKRIGMALHEYHTTFNTLPPGYVSQTRGSAELGPGWGWGALILSRLEQQEPFDALNLSLAITDPGMATVRSTRPSIYICPAMAPDSSALTHAKIRNSSGAALANNLALSHYIASAGQLNLERSPADNNGLFFRNSRISFDDIKDGMSETIMLGERSPLLSHATWLGAIPSARVCTSPDFKSKPDCGPASVLVLGVTGPDTNNSLVDTPGSKASGPAGYHGAHGVGANFAFADGSVKAIKSFINARTFSQLATRSGGEIIDADAY